MVEVINALYSFPVVTAKQISETTSVPITTVNRYLNLLVENRILYTDNKKIEHITMPICLKLSVVDIEFNKRV